MIVLFNPSQHVGALLEQKNNHPVPAAKEAKRGRTKPVT
jgi:hypothetical protein